MEGGQSGSQTCVCTGSALQKGCYSGSVTEEFADADASATVVVAVVAVVVVAAIVVVDNNGDKIAESLLQIAVDSVVKTLAETVLRD